MDGRVNEVKASLGFQTAMLAKRMQRAMQQQFKQAGYEVTFEQWTVLLALWSKDGQSQQELALTSQRDETSLSRLVDTMVRKGLIERSPCPNDRRSKVIRLTEKGWELRHGLIEVVKTVNQLAVHGIDSDDLAVFRKVLLQLQRNVT